MQALFYWLQAIMHWQKPVKPCAARVFQDIQIHSPLKVLTLLAPFEGPDGDAFARIIRIIEIKT